MEKHYKFSIWYVLLGIWVVMFLQNMRMSAFTIKTIPYSEFLTLLKENKVVEVAITANKIQGKIKGGYGRIDRLGSQRDHYDPVCKGAGNTSGK